MSAAIPENSQDGADAGLEREIEIAYRIGMRYAVSDPELSRGAFKVLGLLISKRSPQQIERMELAKGLR